MDVCIRRGLPSPFETEETPNQSACEIPNPFTPFSHRLLLVPTMKPSFNLALLALTGTTAAQTWKNPDGGNTRADISDTKINYGSTPPWYAFDRIKEECLSTGCSSAKSFEYKTDYVVSGSFKQGNLLVSVDGSFNDEGEEGNLDQLVEIVKSVAGGSPYDYTQGKTYYIGNGCGLSGPTPCDRKCNTRPSTRVHCADIKIAGDKYEMDEYIATDMISVRVEAEDGGMLADMTVFVEVEIGETKSGVCSMITTVGSTIGGLVSGIAGGIFSLASLGCS